MPNTMNYTPDELAKSRAMIDRQRGAYKIMINGYRRHIRKLDALARKLDKFEKRPWMFRVRTAGTATK